jgi:hypothetical protein
VAFYRLDVRRGVLGFLRTVEDTELASLLIRRMLSLSDNQVPSEAIRLDEADSLYCLVVDGYDIVYRVNHESQTVRVYGIQKRGPPNA